MIRSTFHSGFAIKPKLFDKAVIDTVSLDISILKSLKPLRTLKQELLFKLNGWTVVSLLVGLFIFFPDWRDFTSHQFSII